jgi:hypothetical protein
MALKTDRLKSAFYALIRAAKPRIDYLGFYAGRVVASSTSGGRTLLDVVPDDDRIPPMARVFLKLGGPGAEVEFDEVDGLRVLVGWENGDPSRPFCCLFEGAEKVTVRYTLKAETIQLNGEVVELGGIDVPTINGVVVGSGIDPFTGATYFSLGSVSRRVKAQKQ